MDESKGKIFREWIVPFVSALAIIVAIRSCIISQEASNSSKTFGEINAEVQWSNLLKSYHDVNEEIKEWEQGQKFEKVDVVVKSYDEMEKALKPIGAPQRIKRLYMRRFESYQSLENMAKLYEPVKERLKRIDFTLPAPPRLPSSIQGVSF